MMTTTTTRATIIPLLLLVVAAALAVVVVVVEAKTSSGTTNDHYYGIVEPGARKSRRAHAVSQQLSHLVKSKFDELNPQTTTTPSPTTNTASPPSPSSEAGGDQKGKKHASKKSEDDDGTTTSTATPQTTTSDKLLPKHHDLNKFTKNVKKAKKHPSKSSSTAAAKIKEEEEEKGNSGGICPANGNLRTLYITTQRGNNIASFDSFGRYLGLVIKSETFPKFFEWRGEGDDDDDSDEYPDIINKSDTAISTKSPSPDQEDEDEAQQQTGGDLFGVQKLRQLKYGPDGLLYAASGRSTLSRIFAISPDGIFPNNGDSSSSVAQITPQLRSESDPLVQQLSMEDRDEYFFSHLPSHLRMNHDCTRNYIYTLARRESNEGSSTPQVFTATQRSKDDDNKKKKQSRHNKRKYGNYDVSPTSSEAKKSTFSSPPALVHTGGGRGASSSSLTHITKSTTPTPPTTLHRTHYYNPNMQHPYDFIFHPDDGTLYVTNQNSLSVTWYVGPTTTSKQLDGILTRSIDAAERALLPAIRADASLDVKKARLELRGNVKRLMMQLMDNRVAPIGEGDAKDPLPLSGGRSGYAGMPLPPSFSVMKTLLTYDALMSNGGRKFNNRSDYEDSNNNNKEDTTTTSKKPSASVVSMIVDPSPSLLLPTEAVGVFASAAVHLKESSASPDTTNHHQGAGGSSIFMSVRGIGISPLLPFSPSEGVFLHELSQRETTRLKEERASRYHLGNSSTTSYNDDDDEEEENDSTSNNDTSTSDKKKRKQKKKTSFKKENGGVEMIRVVVVADVVGNTIHVLHETTGEILWQYVNIVKEPIQIHFPKRALHMTAPGTATHANDYWFYVTSKSGGVYRVPLRREAAAVTSSTKSVFSTVQTLIDQHGRVVVPSSSSSRIGASSQSAPATMDGDNINGASSSAVKAASGFFEDPDHNVAYLADRKGMSVRTYATPDELFDVTSSSIDSSSSSYNSAQQHSTSSSKQYLKQIESAAALEFTGNFVRHLPDFPEFLLYTRVDSQSRMGTCMELTRSGSLKVSSLCRAAQIWILLIVFAVAWVLLTKTRMGVIILAGCCGRTLTSQRVVVLDGDNEM